MEQVILIRYFLLDCKSSSLLSFSSTKHPEVNLIPISEPSSGADIEDPSTNAKIIQLLDRHKATYKTLIHPPTRTSQESADVRGVPLSSGAKAMLLRGKKNALQGGNTFCLAVLSASSKADLKRLKTVLGVKELSMATELEVKNVTGCVPGAVPPFGSLFESVITIADNSLQKQGPCLNFNAGLRTQSVIGLSTKEYYEIEKPLSADFSTEIE